MRRRIILIMLALFTTLCFTVVEPVADQPVVDSQKCRQELETMEGILSTTLGYAVQRMAGNQAEENRAFRFRRIDASDVSGYYVFGQGAVFMIPVSALQRGRGTDFTFDMPEIGAIVDASVDVGLEAAAAGLRAISGETGEVDTEKIKEKAEKLQQQAQERQKQLAQNMEKQKARLQQLQEESKKRRAEMEERHKQLITRLGEVKADLKDALARYGDSLSIMKPDESVTIILSDERGFRWGDTWGGGQTDPICQVLTVKKSLVTDLKAGKITREEFDRRLIDYSY
jgi:hypothetical protein